MHSNSDFVRPRGVEEGVLLNNNLESLHAYKRAKNKMKKIDVLEEKVQRLEKIIERLLEDK